MNVLRTPLTALAVTVKFNSKGRHVGLDFYDLLIEEGDPLATRHQAAKSCWVSASIWRSPTRLTGNLRIGNVRGEHQFDSALHRRSRRSIGPLSSPDKEDRHPFFRVICRHHRRTWEVGPPAFSRVARNKKHQVRMPVHVVVA